MGKNLGRYNLYLGGGFAGDRLNKLYRENLDEDEIVACLEPIIRRYAQERTPGEHFGTPSSAPATSKPPCAAATFTISAAPLSALASPGLT